MDVQAALLQAIHDSPNDLTPRLVLADWLEENDELARAELLRLWVALRQEPTAPDRLEREARVRELLAAGALPCVPALTNSLGMTFVLVPPGQFLMGSPPSEERRRADEGPLHEVEITRPFYLGAFPVTQEQYKRVVGRNPSAFRRGGPDKGRVKGLDTRAFPVERVSWLDAVGFCEKLGNRPEEKQQGRAYRLPSEAEWEYSCREAGTNSAAFHFGPALSSLQANFDGTFPYGGAATGPYLYRTSPVGSFGPNALGLYDMHGNVREWCADWYDPNYYATSPRQGPQGPPEGSQRVVRGGNWVTYGWSCRTAARDLHVPTTGSSFVGFRVVLVVG